MAIPLLNTGVDPPFPAEVPQLAHGLQKVLFNPGVHYFKDPRTKEYNFTPYLEAITQPSDFNYDAITPYITSSKDSSLIDLARAKAKRYVGSTSSISSALAQLYFLMSNLKPVDTACLSKVFTDQPTRFTPGIRKPYTFYLRWKNGVYAIDADKAFDDVETILSTLGKSLEKVLTNEPAQYERYLRVNAAEFNEEDRLQREAYAYGEMGKFLLRSQLDCYDDRLPGKTFDLKTRAVLPIRMDTENHYNYYGYTLKRSQGLYESFEREYYDMMRSAFLKYTFQVRIGHMDGILVAYHNTQTLFGFQYISKEEMDARLFGSTKLGDQVFRNSLYMFETILDQATQKFPEQTLRISFDTRLRQSQNTTMFAYVEPVPTDNEPSTKANEPTMNNNLEEFFQTKETSDETNGKDFSPFEGLTVYQINTSSKVNDTIINGPLILDNYRNFRWSLRMRMQEILINNLPEKQKRFIALRKTQHKITEPSRKNPFSKYLKSLIERNTNHDRF
ncbi:mitochondrial protein Pet127-domain-containing protein [Mycotypha africana]|uniref:mitochondrial protein Pet127-domain-containing protein n=1 Tax=Mycotypha africana TaxID=64632 RepID=UPI002300B620|nr:mitochondrial protein Pet127-domain-containing protein [Mycotypha africana]KAI8968018.1 mitochondrial protein Pet127-domain-containing protein [Mycotypha africana]